MRPIVVRTANGGAIAPILSAGEPYATFLRNRAMENPNVPRHSHSRNPPARRSATGRLPTPEPATREILIRNQTGAAKFVDTIVRHDEMPE